MNRGALQLTIIYNSISYFKTFKVSGVRICMKTIVWEDINQSQMYFKVLWIDTSYHWQYCTYMLFYHKTLYHLPLEIKLPLYSYLSYFIFDYQCICFQHLKLCSSRHTQSCTVVNIDHAVNIYYVGYIVWPSIQYDIDVMHSVWIQPVFDVGAK